MKGGRSKSDTKTTKLSVNKKPTKGGGAAAARKSGKAAKDPNKPKRPASAFFVFMEEFREQYKREHPKNKSVAAVSIQLLLEKAPFVAKADKRKVEYEKKMKAYNKEQAEGPKEEEESEKSMSEVNDDDEDDEEGSGEERRGAAPLGFTKNSIGGAVFLSLHDDGSYSKSKVKDDDKFKLQRRQIMNVDIFSSKA
ncbi:high mobility group B protein 3-like [Populus alba x Populus x berolinensis]|nr:high mobility group B protein 3-like [Populus alba x Populus x berolinensis]